jgi:hypothetical protein
MQFESIFYKESDDEDTEMLLDCCEELGFSRLKQKIKTMLNFADHGTSISSSESRPITLDLSSFRLPKWLTDRKK